MPAQPAQPADPWTTALRGLLARIEAHRFDPGDPLGFTRRLARDHRWTLPFARGAVREHGRFCFLAISPSEAQTRRVIPNGAIVNQIDLFSREMVDLLQCQGKQG